VIAFNPKGAKEVGMDAVEESMDYGYLKVIYKVKRLKGAQRIDKKEDSPWTRDLYLPKRLDSRPIPTAFSLTRDLYLPPGRRAACG
jgi:hypothetical protein